MHLVEAVVAHLRGAETAIQPYNAGLVEMAWRKVLLQVRQIVSRLSPNAED